MRRIGVNAECQIATAPWLWPFDFSDLSAESERRGSSCGAGGCLLDCRCHSGSSYDIGKVEGDGAHGVVADLAGTSGGGGSRRFSRGTVGREADDLNKAGALAATTGSGVGGAAHGLESRGEDRGGDVLGTTLAVQGAGRSTLEDSIVDLASRNGSARSATGSGALGLPTAAEGGGAVAGEEAEAVAHGESRDGGDQGSNDNDGDEGSHVEGLGRCVCGFVFGLGGGLGGRFWEVVVVVVVMEGGREDGKGEVVAGGEGGRRAGLRVDGR